LSPQRIRQRSKKTDTLDLAADEAEADDVDQVEDDAIWDKRIEPVFDDFASFDGYPRQDNDDHSIAA
jgi:hypothetical protein